MEKKDALIRDDMKRRLGLLAADPNDGRVRAQLAILRRGVGRTPGDIPEMWGLIFSDMDERLMSQTNGPTREEWAIYTAITLYALHQQSKCIKEKNMHQSGEENRLGRAVARLIKNDEDRERVARRFNAFATASDMREAAHYLRGLIQLLRAAEIPLDYVHLATDLYFIQFPQSAPNVRLAWGRDFYRIKPKDTNDEQEGQVDKNA